MANLVSATLRLWVYTGNYGTNDPDNPTYIIYKEKSPNSETILFEIGELTRDYIDIIYTGDYSNIVQSAWVKWSIIRTYDDDTTDNDLVGEGITFTGYGYFQDGMNPELSQDLLQSNTKIYQNCNESLNIPILTGEEGVFKVQYFNGETLVSENLFGNTLEKITIDTTEYSADSTILTCDMQFLKNSGSDLVLNVVGPLEPYNKIILTTATGKIITLEVYCICEPKYNPYKISFVNKFGVIQDLWFDKKRTDSLDVQKDSYKRNILETSNETVNYSLNTAQMMPHNVVGNKRIVMNTGFVDEQYNEVIQQLMLTESAWIHENGQVTPVVPKTTSFTYKNTINDKLLNFTVEFDYAFDTINNIR